MSLASLRGRFTILNPNLFLIQIRILDLMRSDLSMHPKIAISSTAQTTWSLEKLLRSTLISNVKRVGKGGSISETDVFRKTERRIMLSRVFQDKEVGCH